MSKNPCCNRLFATSRKATLTNSAHGHLSRRRLAPYTEARTIFERTTLDRRRRFDHVLEIGAKPAASNRKSLPVVVVIFIDHRPRPLWQSPGEFPFISPPSKVWPRNCKFPSWSAAQLTRAPEREERGPQALRPRESGGAIEQSRRGHVI